MSIYNYSGNVFPPFPGAPPRAVYGYSAWASACNQQSPPPPTGEDTTVGTEGGFTVTLKVLSPQNKRDYQQYLLRNIEPAAIRTVEGLRKDIGSQVGEAVSGCTDFPVGFYQESKKMWIQKTKYLRDAWRVLEKNKSLTLWCHGKDSRKRRMPDAVQGGGQDDATESDEVTRSSKEKKACSSGQKNRTTSEEKAREIWKLKVQLEEKHGTKYNGCQYKLWAEMLFAGVHEDMDEAPKVPMFGREAQRRRTGSTSGTDLSDVLASAAVAIKNAFSPQDQSTSVPPKALCARLIPRLCTVQGTSLTGNEAGAGFYS